MIRVLPRLLIVGGLLLCSPFLLFAQLSNEISPKEFVIPKPPITKALIEYYYDAIFEDDSNTVVRDQIKRIINGGRYVKREKAARWLAEVKAGEKRLNLTSSEDAIKIHIFYNCLELSYLLVSLADDIFREGVAKVQVTEALDGKKNAIIPDDIFESKIYLAYAREVLKDVGGFDNHPEKEEIDKIRVNKLRETDLLENMHDVYLGYLKSLGTPEAEQWLEKQEEANRLYATDGQKLHIYINRKNTALAKRSLAALRLHFESSGLDKAANKLAKELEQNEKKYAA